MSLRRLLKLPVVRLHHISELHCRDALSLLRFHITFSLPPSGRLSCLIQTSNQTSHFSSTKQEGSKRSGLDYKLVELLLHLKAASYINNVSNISCVDI